MRIYSETIIEVTDEEIKTISNLFYLAKDENFGYEDIYSLLQAISETKDKGSRNFCDGWDRVYTIKRVEK